MLVAAIDFDGTLVRRGGPPLRWRRGAKEALRRMVAAGHRLILHSCRCNPPQDEEDAKRYEEMIAFLQAEGALVLFAEVWQSPGKPIADVYIDDRAEPPEWFALAGEFGLPLEHGISRQVGRRVS